MASRLPAPVARVTLVTIDPGVRYLAFARFKLGFLVEIGRLTGPPSQMGRDLGALLAGWLGPPSQGNGRACRVVAETPQSYEGKAGRETDLVGLRRTVTACRSAARPWDVDFRTVLPSAWKANVPKPVHHGRVLQALGPDELRVAASADTDEMDAIAIGMWETGRLLRGGVKPPAG